MTQENNKKLDIEEIVAQPKSVEIDGRKVEQHSLSEIIEADRYLASRKATSGRGPGLRISRFRAGGAV